MIPAIHHTCNHVLNPASGDEGRVGKLPVFIHAAGVASFWLPTTLEIAAINRGEPLCVSLSLDLQRQGFPPMAVGLPDDMFIIEKQPAPILEKPSDLAELLARHGIIDAAAIEDPEGYDGQDTAIKIGRAFEELRTVPARGVHPTQ